MKHAAGLLLFKRTGSSVEVLLVHPGGPFWAKKDVWSIPKGELEPGETPYQAMVREFVEEMGVEPPLDNLIDLGEAQQDSPKINRIWAVESNLDVALVHCDSMVTLEWPPHSGRSISFPENDRCEWMELEQAKPRVFPYQVVFLERLSQHLSEGGILEP